MGSLYHTPGFFAALAGMVRNIYTPITAYDDYGLTGFGSTEGSRSLLDGFSFGLLPDQSLSSMLGLELPSRSFLRFGSPSDFLGQGRFGMHPGLFGISSYTPFLNGGLDVYGGGMGIPGSFVPPPPPRFYQLPTPPPQPSAPSAPAGSINIRSGGGDEVKEIPPDPNAITGEMTEGAIHALKEGGYSQEEAEAIVAKAKEIGDKQSFNSLISGLRSKPQVHGRDEQVVAKEFHELGERYARVVHGLDREQSREYVDRVAFVPKASEGGTVGAKRKKVGTTADGKGYEITEGFDVLKKGDYIFYRNKQWYTAKREKIEHVNLPKPNPANPNDTWSVTIPPSGGDDYLTVEYRRLGGEYERYEITERVGKQASGITDRVLFRKDDQFYKFVAGKYEPLGEKSYSHTDRRVYFGRAPRVLPGSLYDFRRYMDRLDTDSVGYKSYKKDLEAAEKLRERIRDERVKAFEKKVREALPDNLEDRFEIKKATDAVEIKVKESHARDFAEAFKKTSGADAVDKEKFNGAFRILPQDTQIEFNGYLIRVGNNPHGLIKGEISGMIPPPPPPSSSGPAPGGSAPAAGGTPTTTNPAPSNPQVAVAATEPAPAPQPAVLNQTKEPEPAVVAEKPQPPRDEKTASPKPAPAVAKPEQTPKPSGKSETQEVAYRTKGRTEKKGSEKVAPLPTVADLQREKKKRAQLTRPQKEKARQPSNVHEKLPRKARERLALFKVPRRQSDGTDQNRLDQHLRGLKAVFAAEEQFGRQHSSPGGREKKVPPAASSNPAPAAPKPQAPKTVEKKEISVNKTTNPGVAAAELQPSNRLFVTKGMVITPDKSAQGKVAKKDASGTKPKSGPLDDWFNETIKELQQMEAPVETYTGNRSHPIFDAGHTGFRVGETKDVPIPTAEDLLSGRYEVAGHKVDFGLSDDMAKDLYNLFWRIDGQMGELKGKNVDEASIIIDEVKRWAFKKKAGWEIRKDVDNLSLKDALASPKPSVKCTDIANFVYTALTHAKNLTQFRSALRDVEIGFVKVYDGFDDTSDLHSCVAVNVGDKEPEIIDVARPQKGKNGELVLSRAYNKDKDKLIDLPTQVATLLSNKAVGLFGKGKRGEAEKMIAAATRLAPSDAHVQFRGATIFYNAAIRYEKRNDVRKMRQFKRLAEECLRRARMDAKCWKKLTTIKEYRRNLAILTKNLPTVG